MIKYFFIIQFMCFQDFVLFIVYYDISNKNLYYTFKNFIYVFFVVEMNWSKK